MHLLKSVAGVKCLLYADDLVMWTESSKKQAAQHNKHILNLALESLEQWCDKNNMKINLDKTIAVSFSLTHQPLRIDLLYGGHAISEADNFIYLGVTFDRKLSWRAHAENMVDPVSPRMALKNDLLAQDGAVRISL